MLEFNNIITNLNNGIHSTPILKTILSNVIYTSIILSIILIIVILFIYPPKDDSGWVLIKLLIYLSIANTIILSSYQSNIMNKYKEKYMNDTNTNFITNINNKSGGSIYHDQNVKVIPNFKKSDEIDEIEENNNTDDDNVEISAANILDDVERKI